MKLTKLQPISTVNTTTGQFNLIVNALFANIDELATFIQKRFFGIDDIVNWVVFPVLLPQANGDKEQSIVRLDDLDQKIIALLQFDGRKSNNKIGKELGISADSVRRRIDRLVRNEVIRIRAVINISKSDWLYEGVVAIYVKSSLILTVLEKLKSYREVSQAVWISGQMFNLIAAVRGESEDSVYKKVEESIASIDGVEHCEVFILKDSKYGPRWSHSYLRSHRRRI
jgi:Lrp/AsnC family transcriptional regulator for asnA, asnC and gidA